jgi:hypothetical protein
VPEVQPGHQDRSAAKGQHLELRIHEANWPFFVYFVTGGPQVPIANVRLRLTAVL